MIVPWKYHPVACPQCGKEIGRRDQKWKCSCGDYTYYPYDNRVEREMHSFFFMHIHPSFKGGKSRKSKRYDNKKATSFMNRYYLDT